MLVFSNNTSSSLCSLLGKHLLFLLMSPSGLLIAQTSLPLAFEPLPARPLVPSSLHALSVSEAHSFDKAASRLLEQMGQ